MTCASYIEFKKKKVKGH